MVLVIKDFKGQTIDFKRKIAFNRELFDKNFKDLKCEDNVVLSSDHANSYFLLKEYAVDGLVVVDQHIDLWDFKGFNKSNFFRRCFEEKLIKFIVFVGVRESEMEEFKFEKERFNVEIVKTDDFNEGVLNAFDILKKKGMKNIAIDIDLDAFDSDIIKGVEYCKENLKNVLDDRKEYIEKQLNEKGLNIDFDVEKLKNSAIENNLNILYWHITEFEPEFDDGKTLELIKEIIR